MASLTLKDVPLRLHRALKERSVKNRRSLQSEILATLEDAVWPKPIPSDQVLERIRRFHDHVRLKTTDAEITRFKREGRR